MSFPILKFTQPAGDFYLTALPAEEILRIAKPSPRRYDPKTHTTFGGIQREPSRQRVAEISDYCRTVDAAFPTAIILSLPSDNVDISAKEGRIRFQGESPFADIVDGQHRILGLQESEAAGKFTLPVVLVLDATDDQKALLFATINGKQTKVSASLIYELFEVIEGRTPQKTAHEIARVMNAKSESPWFDRLKMLGRRTREESNETVTQGTFVRLLLEHLTSDADADFDMARRGGTLEPDRNLAFRRYFLHDEDEVIVRVLMNVFGAQRETWPQDWDDPQRSILTKTTGFWATMLALKTLVDVGHREKDLSKRFFLTVFRQVKTRFAREKLAFVPDDFPSSGRGIRKLRDYFVARVEH
jgi:DGQHR domain-containing protein